MLYAKGDHCTIPLCFPPTKNAVLQDNEAQEAVIVA